MYLLANINNGISMKTKVLTTKHAIAKGMMGRKFTKEFFALLFVMDNEDSPFWMKNCIVPLDVVFIKDSLVTKVHHSCPPCKPGTTCKFYRGIGDLVMELPGGSCKALKIARGSKITFSKLK